MAKQNIFLDIVKDTAQEEDIAKVSDGEIITNFFKDNIKGDDKIVNPFEEYNSEDAMLTNLVPGCIYNFIYQAETPGIYMYGKQTLEFTDKLPLVLVLSVDQNYVQGINLNLCTKDLRIIILNIICNIDPDFIDSEAKNLASDGKKVVSTAILSFFNNKEYKTKFLQFLSKAAKIEYDFIFRVYKKKLIKNLHYIEPWQWKYIPFITNDNSSLKAGVLNVIHKLTGISNIKMGI